MKAKAGKVESIGARRQADVEREAHLIAEACARSNPSEEAKAYVRAHFDADPEDERRSADLTGEAMRLAVKEVDLGFYRQEAIARRVARAKAALGYESATHAERMLIDHVVMCDVRLAVVELLHSTTLSGTYSIAQGDYWERRLTLTQKRFERAMVTLAKTRALLARAEAFRAGSKLRAVGTNRAA